MCLLRYYLIHEPAGFDVFCFRWNTLVSRSGSRPFGGVSAGSIRCTVGPVRNERSALRCLELWVGHDQGGCSLRHLDALSLALIGNVAAGGWRDEPWCGSPDIFDKET
jgi:hypothetical protein